MSKHKQKTKVLRRLAMGVPFYQFYRKLNGAWKYPVRLGVYRLPNK